jgi:hypothetical protein
MTIVANAPTTAPMADALTFELLQRPCDMSPNAARSPAAAHDRTGGRRVQRVCWLAAV